MIEQRNVRPPRVVATPIAGGRVRWFGRTWHVNWVHRQLLSLTAEADGRRELIHENGADGPYEVLA